MGKIIGMSALCLILKACTPSSMISSKRLGLFWVPTSAIILCISIDESLCFITRRLSWGAKGRMLGIQLLKLMHWSYTAEGMHSTTFFNSPSNNEYRANKTTFTATFIDMWNLIFFHAHAGPFGKTLDDSNWCQKGWEFNPLALQTFILCICL